MTAELRTKLSRVKGLGSAHHGTGHWWQQRLTALALLPLLLWFVSSLLKSMLSSNVIKVVEWFASPAHAVLFMLLILMGFYHAKLGAQVVIEDYVKAPFAKYGLLVLNNFFCVVGIVISVMAVLKLHFLDIISSAM